MAIKKNKKHSTTLVIGDAHVCPRHSNERFKALAGFIADRNPTNIVNIGDFLSLDSLSTHDMEFPLENVDISFAQDVAAGKEAYDLGLRAAAETTEGHLLWLNGNHEDRAGRFVKSIPTMRGTVDPRDLLGVEKDGWQIVPFNASAYIDGCAFTHIPLCKRSSKPLGGDHVAKRALDVYGTTVVFGHTHRMIVHDAFTITESGDAKRRCGINVGWFGDYCPKYVSAKHTGDWWNGLVLLTHTAHGEVDVETVSMSVLKSRYL